MTEVLFNNGSNNMLIRGKIVRSLKTVIYILSSDELYRIQKNKISMFKNIDKWIYL